MRRLNSSIRWLLATACVWLTTNGIEAVVPTFQPPQKPATFVAVPGGNFIYIHDTSIDGSGNLIAVWGEMGTKDLTLKVAILPHEGMWSESTVLYHVDDMQTLGSTPVPRIAMNAQGEALVVWHEQLGPDKFAIKSAQYSSGKWSALEDLHPQSAYNPIVTLNEAGYAVAAWTAVSGGDTLIQASTLAAGQSTWSKEVTISSAEGGWNSDVDLALNDAGNTIAVWNYHNLSVQAAMLPYQGQWTTPVTVTPNPGEWSNWPKVVMNASGYAVAVWLSGEGQYANIQAATVQFGQSWSQPACLTTHVKNRQGLSAAIDSQGNAIAIWSESEALIFGQTSSPYLQISRLPYGKTWSTPDYPAPKKVYSLLGKVAFDENGNAVTAWYNAKFDDPANVTAAFHTTVLPNGGHWSGHQKFSVAQHNGFFSLGITPSGSAVISWLSSENTILAAKWKPFITIYELKP